MDLTTLARVREVMKVKGSITTEDSIIERLIEKYSQVFRLYMDRETEVASRTETRSIITNQDVLMLKAYPVTSVTTVKWSDTMDFSGSSELEDNNDYVLEPESGILNVRFGFQTQRSYLQVVYTAGMAADTSAFITAYPDIADSVDLQVMYHLRRYSNPNSSLSVSSASKTYDSPLKLLPEVLEVLDRHRRMTV